MKAQNKTQNESELSVNDLLKLLPIMFTELSDQEQELSLAIYRHLAKGSLISIDQLVSDTSLIKEEIKTILEYWPGIYYKGDKIIGYWGLTVSEMGHMIHVDDRTLYGWCAWDTLFIPQLLGKPATIISKDQTSKEEIIIKLDKNGNLIEANGDIKVSMLIPAEEDINEDVISSFCHFIFFFKNEENGQIWVEEHPNTFLISLVKAIELSQAKNKLQYKNEFDAATA